MSNVEKISSRAQEVNIGHTNRPYFASVNAVCSEEGHQSLGINTDNVDKCVAMMMQCFQGFTGDEVITAIGIAFILMMRRFKFTLPSYIGFVESFLKSDDLKLGCHAMQRFLESHFKDTVTRFQRVDFNHTRTVKF